MGDAEHWTKEARQRVEIIPQIDAQEKIFHVMKQTYSAFDFYKILDKIDIKGVDFFPNNDNEQEIDIPEREINTIQQYASNPTKLLKYLCSHPSFCSYAIDKIGLSQVQSMLNKKTAVQLLYIAFYSQNIQILESVILEKGYLKEKDYKKLVIDEFTNYLYSANNFWPFFPDLSRTAMKIPLSISEKIQPTAFAVNSNTIFIGKGNGMIQIINKSSNNTKSQYSAPINIGNQNYSFGYAQENLWLFTKEIIYSIDINDKCKSTELSSKKPKHFSPPIISDGKFFYSMKNEKKFAIYVNFYDCKSKKFVRSHKVVLKKPQAFMKAKGGLNLIPMATDGGVISFLYYPKPGYLQNYIYSLSSGDLLIRKEYFDICDIMAWTIIPHTCQHVILTAREIIVTEGTMNVPRWIESLPPPFCLKLNPIMTELYSSLYCGSSIFQKSNVTTIVSILEKYISSDINMVFLFGHVLMHNSDHSVANSVLNLLNNNFDKFKTQKIQQFGLFLYLFFHNVSHARVKEDNYVSKYFEDDSRNFSIIWSYPQEFDFRNIVFSPKALSNIMSFVIKNWTNYPEQASVIVINYLNSYMSSKVNAYTYDLVKENLKGIMNQIKKQIELVIKESYPIDDFVKSSYFKVWDFLINFIINSFELIEIASDELAMVLDFALLRNPIASKNADFYSLMNQTFVVFFECLFSSPYQITSVRFSSASELYNKSQSPLNDYNKELDEKIIKTLNKAYGIVSEKSYIQHFNTIRKYLIFDKPECISLLDNIPKGFKTKYLMDYLMDPKNRPNIPLVKENNIFLWFIKKYNSYSPVFTKDQTILFASFTQKIEERKKYFLEAKEEDLNKFVSLINIPFVLPTEILIKSNHKISSKFLLSYEGDLLKTFQDKFIQIFPQITEPELLVDQFINSVPADQDIDYSTFSSIDDEPKHYKSALLFYIALKGGYKFDYKLCLKPFYAYITLGSVRIIEVIMKCICVLEEIEKVEITEIYQFLMKQIITFLHDLRNPFPIQTNPNNIIVSVFIIIVHLKQAFNSSTKKFLNFICDYASNVDSPKGCVPIYAILNNSIEVIREGIEINLTNDFLEKLEAKVISYDFMESKLTAQVDGSSSTVIIQLSKCKDIWCECPVVVNLEFIKDFKPFHKIFFNKGAKVHRKNNHINVFKYASLLEFMKMGSFYDSISEKDIDKLIIQPKEWPRTFKVESLLYDFLTFLSFAPFHFPALEFTNVSEPSPKPHNTPVITNLILNDPSIRQKHEGLLLTNDNPCRYVSSPIHPFCRMNIKFTMFDSVSSNQHNAFVFKILCLTRPFSVVMESKEYFSQSTVDSTEIYNIIFDPSKKLVIIERNEKQIDIYAVSPAIVMFYIDISVKESTILEYSAEYSETMHVLKKVSNMPKSFELVDYPESLFKVSSQAVEVPHSDSYLYNIISLNDNSANLADSLQVLINNEIMKRKSDILAPNVFLQLLAAVNPFPEEEVFSIHDLKSSNGWKNYNQNILEFLIKHVELHGADLLFDLHSAFNKMIQSAKSFCIRNYNKSALFTGSDTVININNCYIFEPQSELPFRKIGYPTHSQQAWKFSKPCGIIPFEDTSCSAVDFLLAAKHLFVIILFVESYDFSALLASIQKLQSRGPFYTPLFKNLLSLIYSISPRRPERNAFRSIKTAALFIKQSLVYTDPQTFALPLIVENYGKPEIFNGVLPNPSKALKDQKIYIGIHDSNASGQRFTFTINDQKINSNSYQILDNGNINIVLNDNEVDMTSLTFILNMIPDVDSIISEWKEWKSHHSHQLLTSVFENKSVLTEQLYQLLPLSTKFRFDTAKFFYKVLSEEKISQIFSLRSNQIDFTQKNSIFDSKSYLFSKCCIITDYSTPSNKRITYLIRNGYNYYTQLDSSLIRIMGEIQDYKDFKSKILPKLSSIFLTLDKNSKIKKWILEFLKSTTTYVILQFFEFCTGSWGCNAALNTSMVCIHIIDEPNIVETSQSENILIIGSFDNQNDFIHCLLSKLDEFHCYQFS